MTDLIEIEQLRLENRMLKERMRNLEQAYYRVKKQRDDLRFEINIDTFLEQEAEERAEAERLVIRG